MSHGGKKRTLLFKPGSDFKGPYPALPHPTPNPAPSGRTWSQSTIKFTQSRAPLGISVSICIFARWALCIGLCVRGGLQARNRSVCSCASVKIWAELSEPSVSKQTIVCWAPGLLTRLPDVCGAEVRLVVFVFGDWQTHAS